MDGQRINFGATFYGYIAVPEQGMYTLAARSDDGTILYLGDEEIINNDKLQPMTQK